MTDREKVIEILSRHKTMTFGDKPYDGIQFNLGDVVALLKEQEAVEPYSMNAERTYGICPKCGKFVFRYSNVEENHYCGICGQAVKWNG